MTASWLIEGESQRMPRFVQDVGAFIVADLPDGRPRELPSAS